MRKLFVVGIGASAGGLQALEAFFAHLPENPNAAFVVIQHLSPNFRSLMTELIQRQTKIPVHQIQDGMTLVSNAIYILPPGKNLSLENQQLQLLEQPERFNYPINQFFQALARNCSDRAIGILLSGTGNDGTEGLQAISRAGGIALVQSAETAQFTSMPTSALPSGLVDEILSPQDLAESVYGLVHFATDSTASPSSEVGLIDPNQLQRILDILAEREQIDFSHYKISTLSRRIAHRLALTRSSNLENYIRLLEHSEDEQKLLRQDMLIGATRFFRDKEAWDLIETSVLPMLIERLEPQQQLRIWVSACATGEEAYSMAMLVDEAIARADKPIQVKIFATDLDTNALEAASYGVYTDNVANQISPERLERYFTPKGDQYQVKRTLREMLIIAPHDLTKNAGFSKMNLVCCRNVLIYMQPQLQQQVLRLLHFSLATQGILFLGNSETLGDISGEFTPFNNTWKVFQKRRDIQLSLSPINRPPIVSPISSIGQHKARRTAFEPILEDVFDFCFAERKITCLLVNQDGLLLYVFCNTAGLLELSVGEARLEVTQVILPPLRLPLSTALHRAKRDKETVLYSDIKIRQGDEDYNVTLRVTFNRGKSGIDHCLIVLLEIETPPIPQTAISEFEISAEAAQQITELEYELQQTRENLQVTIEELEIANEEQQATNEELLASNEELQSTNEELQSVNEELYTVNGEYQTKIEQLTQLSNDINNLLRSTDLGVVFLDSDLNIRKLTPTATRYINIRDTDINRPLTHFTHNLDCSNFLDILRQVIVTEQAIEREVTLLPIREVLLMRVNPYQQEDGSNDGVVVTFINITELKQTQTQLRTSNAILENLFSASPVGLSLHDRNLRFLKINQALADMNGFSVEEHLSKDPSELMPELHEQIAPIFEHVRETGEPRLNIEIQGKTPAKPDEERNWLASYYPVELADGERGVGAVIVDITELKRTQQALQDSRNLIEQITESSPGIIYIYDLEEWRYVYVNQSIKDILGYTPDKILQIGATIVERIVHPEDRAVVQGYLESFQEVTDNRRLECEHRAPHKDGTWRWLYLRSRVFQRTATGRAKQILGIATDITHRKQIELELQQAKAASDAANRAKSEFLANMSHELRTPLNAILGFSQLMSRNPELTPILRENLQAINRSGEHLLSLINTVLDLAKIEARRMSLEESPCDFYDLLHEIEEMLWMKVESKGLHFTFELNPDVPRYLVVDHKKLCQILTNLLGNAVKCTAQGCVYLRVQLNVETPTLNTLEKQTASEVEKPLTLKFEVEDTGSGIADDELEHIFEAFAQGKSTDYVSEGTGLGLTISRSFVELMGGTISVISILGEGSTFSFWIPVRLASADEIKAIKRDRQVVGLAPDQPNYKILVVDDQQENRRLLVQILSSIGFEVREASQGKEAIALWQEWQPQLIFMDILMPGMNGYQVTQEIRAQEMAQEDTTLPPTKIIALTALAMKSDRDQALAAGCDDFLSKPFRESELFDQLAQHLEVRYVYTEREKAETASKAVFASPVELKSYIAQMPQAWAEQMQEAALLGRQNQVMELIEQIPADKAVLAQGLIQRLKRFDYESILAIFDVEPQ